jgi:3-hydroxymyristoyl/3-hydroxydecanoyl-(acyl carrier protein) dehydratase
MLVSKEHIREYLVQQDPIVMVDTILENTENGVVTGFCPGPHNIFVKDGKFTEPGLVENMAQTAAAKAGYEARLQNADPLVGFIGAVKNLKIYSLPNAESDLQTKMQITNRIMNVNIASIAVSCDEQVVAECEMKIFLESEEKQQWV